MIASSSHVPNITIAVPVYKREISSTIARLLEKHLIDTAAKVRTAGVKDKWVLNATEAAKSLHLSPELMTTQEPLL